MPPSSAATGTQKLDAASLTALLAATQADPSQRSLRLSRAGLTPNLAVQIADFLEVNRSVTALDLSGNAIGSHGANCIAASLETNDVLQQLTLAGCALASSAVAPFAAYFANETNTPKLQSIDLSDNQVDDDAAEALAALVAATSSSADQQNEDEEVASVALDLRKNWLGDDTMRTLAKAMQTNRTLRTVRLEGNQDEDAHVAKQQIAFCLQRNHRWQQRRALLRQLRGIRDATLFLHECALCFVELPLTDAQLLSDALRVNRSVLSLELRDNALPNEGTCCILQSLERHPSLRRLRIHDNEMGDSGFKALCPLLQQSASLAEVAIIHSGHAPPPTTAQLTRQTLAALHHTLARDALALRMLAFVNCGFGDVEVGVVASGIAWACCLESLDLRNNAISDRTAHVLARLLQRCRRLHTLDVSGNRLTLDGGALVIARASVAHSAMRTLRLGRFPHYEPTAVESLVACLRTSATLVRVELTTKERTSRCAELLTLLHDDWTTRRNEFNVVGRAQQTQEREAATRHVVVRTIARRLALTVVTQWLRPFNSST